MMSRLSINIFKEHPGNKVTLSNTAFLGSEHKIMGSRPKMIFCVHGSMRTEHGGLICDVRWLHCASVL